MTKDYEGKIGIGQLFLCLLAAATLAIPFVFEPQIDFAFNSIMPIGENAITALQSSYFSALMNTVGVAEYIPETVNEFLPYTLYVFYGILAFDIFFTFVLMILRIEVLRVLIRALSVLLGFATLAVFLVSLATTAGFFTFYIDGGFGEGAMIFDCIKNFGLPYFFGVTVFSIIVTVKQFSSFFGKSY